MTSPDFSISEQAVALDGVAPSPGDSIDLAVTAKVTRVEGGRVFFAPTAVNGEPVPGAEGGTEARPGEQPLGEDELRAMAAKADGSDDMQRI
jgi:hypothetical protein